MMQPLEGCAAYIIKQEGRGVEARSTTAATTGPSDILENPLPSQKRKGCDICGGLKQLPKLSARRAHRILKRNNSWNCFKGVVTYKTKSIYCNYSHIYANSKYGTQLYINKKTGPLLWPQMTIPVRFGILAL